MWDAAVTEPCSFVINGEKKWYNQIFKFFRLESMMG